uniref:Putative homing endonuclease n=1 Tax=viral metagenome TaxID=1070528 RepID=A0A6M3KDM8_9ZZZZ
MSIENPQIDEIVKASELGFKGNGYLQWYACPDCGKERWVQLRGRKLYYHYCKSCAQRRRPPATDITRDKISKSHLKNGIRKNPRGYVEIYLFPSDFFFPMANKSRHVFEHRLVMAKHLGRCLHPFEIIHHKNSIKDDNRIENLQLVSNDKHNQITLLDNRVKYLESMVTTLESEIKELKLQIKNA